MYLKELELSGLELVDPNADYSGTQTIFIDFDGANGVAYDNDALNIHIDNLSVAHSGLSEEEQFKIITDLNNTFADTSVTFTITAPTSEEYSTIYVGGDDSAFSAYGSFLGIAETIDVGNQIKNDEAFVFSDNISSTVAITETIAHEAGHLIGFMHEGDEIVGNKISDFAQDYKSPLKSNEDNPTKGSYSKSITIEKGSSHRFIVDGVFGMSESCNFTWYSTDTGTSGVITSGSSYTLNDWYDPTLNRTFNSTGSYTIRAEIWDRTWTGSSGEWWEAHRWYVNVVYDNLGPYSVGSLDLESYDDSGNSSSDNITKYDDIDFDWSAPSDRGVSGITSGVKGYYYELDDSTPDLKYTTSTSCTMYDVSEGSHKLYVRAVDNNNNLGDVKSISFTVDKTAPGTPILYSPNNGTTIYDQTPYFDWGSVSGTDYYEIEVHDGDISWGDISTTTSSSSYTPSSNIPLNDTYYWKVRATDDAGNVGSWSSVRSFYLAGQPDLIVSDISWSPSSPEEGDSITITVTGKNQGGADINSSIDIYYYVDGSYVGKDDFYYGLNTNQSNNESYTISSGLSSGSHTITAVIDPNDVYDEENDNNNSRSETITIKDPPKPDLDVISVTLENPKSIYQIGDGIDAEVTVKNIGEADADGCKVRYYFGTSSDYDKYDTGESGTLAGINGMQPNETETDWLVGYGDWTIPVNITEGTYSIWVNATTSSDDSDSSNDWGASNTFYVNHTPDAPTNIQVTGTTSSTATITWDGVSSVDNITYYVQYGKDWSWDGWNPDTALSTNDTSITIDNLVSGKKYDVRVWVEDSHDGVSDKTVVDKLFTTKLAGGEITDARIVDKIDNNNNGKLSSFTVEVDIYNPNSVSQTYSLKLWEEDLFPDPDTHIKDATNISVNSKSTTTTSITVSVDTYYSDLTDIIGDPPIELLVELYNAGFSEKFDTLESGDDADLNNINIEKSEDDNPPGVVVTKQYWADSTGNELSGTILNGSTLNLTTEVSGLDTSQTLLASIYDKDLVNHDDITNTPLVHDTSNIWNDKYQLYFSPIAGSELDWDDYSNLTDKNIDLFFKVLGEKSNVVDMRKAVAFNAKDTDYINTNLHFVISNADALLGTQTISQIAVSFQLEDLKHEDNLENSNVTFNLTGPDSLALSVSGKLSQFYGNKDNKYAVVFGSDKFGGKNINFNDGAYQLTATGINLYDYSLDGGEIIVQYYSDLGNRSKLLDKNDYDLLGDSEGNNDKLIVMVHGWNRTGKDGTFSDSGHYGGYWIDLAENLDTVINSSDWDLLAYDWTENASTGGLMDEIIDAPTSSLNTAVAEGYSLAKQIMDWSGGINNLSEIQFISHSAGNWAAIEAGRYLNSLNSDINLQITALDPFVPDPGTYQIYQDVFNSSASVFDKTENYYVVDDLGSDLIGYWTSGDYEESWNINRDLAIPQTYLYDDIIQNHDDPIGWYAETVKNYNDTGIINGDLKEGDYNLGFGNSLLYNTISNS
ncbi:MAG: fibronectin type III domain-containing protein, partial [Victivallaceae bacterium]|nr:fibronectin type III domain-containing protein [Victivallaceae bacterium]